MKTVSAADANRHFSSLLRDVRSGESVTVLSRGKPVAVIAPLDQSRNEQRQAAKLHLMDRLRHQEIQGERTWKRDDLYED
jgi:prevent-host-death family protein